MTPKIIAYDDVASRFDWGDAVAALREGHKLPQAEIGDIFLGPADGTMLSRGAFVPGLGYGLKSVTVFDKNAQHGLQTVQGAMLVFEPDHGQLSAIVDSKLVTEIKTAADSVLGASLLARTDSETLLIVGAGTVAHSLVKAYRSVMPSLKRIMVWSRRREAAESMAKEFAAAGIALSVADDLEAAVATADIVATATMAREPILRGDWVKPGTHVDLIGAFKSDMREADDDLISTGTLFVDSRDTTIDHIGELKIPIANGVIKADAVKADFYDLVAGSHPGRRSEQEITVFKNGGGAHLDLMIAGYLVSGF